MTQPKVSFHAMRDVTFEDYNLLRRSMKDGASCRTLAVKMLEGLRGNPGAYLVDRYTHSLQTATRAMQDGADTEMVVCALLHDIGEVASPFNHAAVGAEVLQPFISDENYQILRHHGLFQSFYYAHLFGDDTNARDVYREEPWYQACADFCERWDQASFDPDYETYPLTRFMPLLESFFAVEPHVTNFPPIAQAASE